jgi:transposase
MGRAKWLQETRLMRFEEAYMGWRYHRLTQEEAAQLLGVCERTFRRYIDRYHDEGLDGLLDKRMEEVSQRKAPADEVLRLEVLYRENYQGWNVQHFYERYRDVHEGDRGYTWVKQALQAAKLVPKGRRKGKHRKHRERAPLPGMMIHQDGSTHQWVPGKVWDLIVTLDDANSEIYSAFFVPEEGTLSSFRGIDETISKKGLFSTFYSDRGGHYWYTPKAGEPVDKRQLTQFGRAMQQLGIQMIPAYSPQARGRSERMFKTLQDRLPKELALEGITDMDKANQFLKQRFLRAFNKSFMVKPREEGCAFVPLLGVRVADILCIQEERTVGGDNCVQYLGRTLQIPKTDQRCHYVKAKVRIHAYPDGTLGIFHGPRCLVKYRSDGREITTRKAAA